MSYSPHRIQIVGSSNAGKSTLATRLAAETGFPRVELDALNWKPNWQGRHQHEPDEFRRLTSAFAIPTLFSTGCGATTGTNAKTFSTPKPILDGNIFVWSISPQPRKSLNSPLKPNHLSIPPIDNLLQLPKLTGRMIICFFREMTYSRLT